MSVAYTSAGRIVTGHDGGYHETWGDVSRCGSCGSLVLAADQGIHDGHHARLDRLIAMVTGPLVVEGKITLNDAREVMGFPAYEAPTT